jgi:hypothetical protein
LFEAELPVDVPLEDANGFLIQVQILDPKVSQSLGKRLLPRLSLPLANLD